jgi:hypothetical protein
MKHFVMAVRAGMPPEPQVVAELGPGDGSVALWLREGAAAHEQDWIPSASPIYRYTG